MIEILLATGNAGKRKEMLSFFKDISGVSWKTLADIKPIEEPEETAETFEENALQKARYYAQKTGMVTLGEDSGLNLSALPDAFGVRTRREIDAKTDVDWLRIFLEMLEEKTDRRAVFSSAMALYDPNSQSCFTVLGQTKGEMVEFPGAPIEPGIPVSSVFVPEGFDEVYSAMTTQQKNKCSHRGKAAARMAAYIRAAFPAGQQR